MIQTLMHVRTSGEGVVGRRTFLRDIGVGLAGAGLLGWKDNLLLHADEMKKQNLACILLFMRGGPSHLDTFDPKPDTPTGGPTKAIDTAVSGIRIADSFPKVAKTMKDIALIRSMTNKEGEHIRATFQMHTGYLPTGSVKFPSLGSIVATEIGKDGADLPRFVSISTRSSYIGSGFLGASVAPFFVTNPEQMPNNTVLPPGVSATRLNRRLGLLHDLEVDFAQSGGGPRVEGHKAIYDNASKLVLSPQLKAFDLKQENDKVRERYGKTPFGQGCLLARRLVEAGVTFVEVELNGWDTHKDNFTTIKTLSDKTDPAFAALVSELKERGRLENTLVIWMGEFGRTPKINGDKGRDHYPRAFCAALAGGGIKGGQVIGETSSSGADVKSRPVTVPDLFCTFYQALKINPRKENITPQDRPVKLMDGGNAIKELF